MNRSIIGVISAAGIISAVSACGSTTTVVHDVTAPAPAVTKTVTANPAPKASATTSAPQIIINNNPAPAPSPVYVAPVPVYTPPTYYDDPYSVVSEYMNDISTPGGIPAAWNLLSSNEQAGWSSNYNSFYTWAAPMSVSNIYEDSESGDTVTVTYTQSGNESPTTYTVTFVVDNGIIMSDNWSQNY